MAEVTHKAVSAAGVQHSVQWHAEVEGHVVPECMAVFEQMHG